MGIDDFFSALWKGILILLALNFAYFLTFKLIRWKSNSIVAVLKRIRVWAYLLANLFSLWWFVSYFPATKYTPFIVSAVEIVFFFIIGILVIEMFNSFFFEIFLPRISKAETLNIYRQLLIGALYVLLVFLSTGYILHIDITQMLTTSAIISVVIGLALQDTLGNLFSGLALNLSNPYRLGDFVKIGNYEGKVVAIDWRSISLLTMEDNIVTFPHSSIAKMEIQNYSMPTLAHCRTLTIGVHYHHSPHKVEKALLSVLESTDGVLNDPHPRVRLLSYGDSSITYKMVFWIDDFANNGLYNSGIMEKIWYKFKREHITIPYPIRDVYMREAEKEISLEDKLKLLSVVDFLSPLDRGDLEHLGARLRILMYHDGEVICSQDDRGNSFYIVKSGRVEVTAVNEKGEQYLRKEMNEGSFFGEISLLTGDPRTATVKAMGDVELLTLGKEDLRFIITSNPQVEKILSSALAKRQQHSITEKARMECSLAEECDQVVEGEIGSLANEFLNKIRYFFSY
jgi:small-conductance mechanosensitive channel/CRP-like cAMP-binding protein